MSTLSWESLYQSNPIINTGTLFKQSYFKYWTENEVYITIGETNIRKDELRIYQTIDQLGPYHRQPMTSHVSLLQSMRIT